MKKLLIISILLIVVINTYAQNEIRELRNFSFLKVRGGSEVILSKGDKNEVKIVSDDAENFQKIKTEILDNELTISSKGKLKSGTTVYLTYKNILEIDMSGASELRTMNAIEVDNIKIKGSGAMKADLEILSKELNLNFSGASGINLKGKSDHFQLNLSGASRLDASNFIAKNSVVDISGASDGTIHTTNSIEGKVSGASTMRIKGKPSRQKISKTGAATAIMDYQKYLVDYKKHLREAGGKNVELSIFPPKVEKEKRDTTEFSFGTTKFLMIHDSTLFQEKVKKRKNHWAGVDFALNGFLNAENSLDLANDPALELSNPEKVTQFMELNYRKSWSVSINFMEHFFRIKEHHFGIVTGLGFEWNNYELSNNVRLIPNGGSNVFDNPNDFNQAYTWGEIDTVLDYSKNRFKTWFINVPLLLEINTGEDKDKSFHISAGAIFGFNLQTKVKYKYELDGDVKKEKDKQSFNTNPFRTSLTTRLGYGWFNVFATYSLTQLFENGKGPELYPFTVGITLAGF